MMRRAVVLVSMVVALLWLGCGFVAPVTASEPLSWRAAQPAGAPVIVLEVDGVINPLTARYLERSLRQAEERDATLVIVMLDTPGGLDSSMRAMVESLLNSPVPTAVYVAPSGARAASAGMFITIAADVAAMAPATNIGAASPVALGGGAGDTEIAKATSDAAALARGIAERRGRNAAWAERAVVESVSLTAAEALDENVIDVVAEDLDDLLRQLDGREVDARQEDSAGAAVRLQTAGAPVERRPMTWSEQLIHVISDPNIAYVLLTLGILLLLAELAHPGLSLTGLGSAICFILAFMALGSLPVNWAGVALLAAAAVFFVAGLLTDTEAVLGIGGLIAFVLGSLLLFSPFQTPSPAAPIVRVSLWLIGAMALLIAGSVLIVLAAIVRARRLPPQTGAERLIGLEGIALTDLNPGGQVRVDLGTWSAVSIGGEIRSGERVRVVGFAGVRLRVVPADLDSVWERAEEA